MNPACPACGSDTLRVEAHGVEAFECGRCDGHGLRGSELERFFNERDVPRRFTALMRLAGDAPRTRRLLTCPDCRTRSYHVVRTYFIEVDVCATCVGLYLDKGEADDFVRRTHASTKVLDQVLNAIQQILEEILD